MDNECSILAGLVLFNSDYSRLLKCVDSLVSEVDEIVIFDNSPECLDSNRVAVLESKKGCSYIHSEKNLGMPGALNRITVLAKEKGHGWVLTMNADSVVPDGMISKFVPFMHQKDIGMICPQVIDKRRKYMIPKRYPDYESIKMCITSGTLTRISAMEQVGGFDEWLFVDLLDNDLSKRFTLNGWKIIQVNNAILDQEFGEILPKPKHVMMFWLKVGKIFNNNNFAKFSYKKIVHANRVYYTCRNILYLNKKFKNYGGIGYKENYNCNNFIGFIVCFVLPSILRADNKIKVIKAVCEGFSHGKKAQVKPWVAEKAKL